MIVAGEVSGDMHAARLVKAARKRLPGVHFFGIGGDEMSAAGVEILQDINDMAVMGLSDVLRRFPFFARVFNETAMVARARRPDAVILVDYPGFNLRFAARSHALGLKTIYYICPQVWAWNRSRIPRMAESVDCLITLFPFERDYFKDTRMRVEFVGHPLVGEAQEALREPAAALPWEGAPRVALLPGSRIHEIERILPAMWDAAAILEKSRPEASFIIATPSAAIEEVVKRKLKTLADGPSRCSVISGQTRQALRQADAAFVASGTATVEASLMLCPMVIVYRTSALTYMFARMLVRVHNIGMVNIVAGKTICPEFVQGKATPAALARAIEPFLSDGTERTKTIDGLKQVNQALGPPGAEDRAADIVARELEP